MNTVGLNAAMKAAVCLSHFGLPRKKTYQGQWYRLASLFYEAMTGSYDADLSKSCRIIGDPYDFGEYIVRRSSGLNRQAGS
jgi:hypothetical protein